MQYFLDKGRENETCTQKSKPLVNSNMTKTIPNLRTYINAQHKTQNKVIE